MTSSSTPWWSKDTVAVVTGSNKGIGYETVRQLADKGITVVLTARDPTSGQAAVDALKADGDKSIWFHPLDVCSRESVEALATWLKNQFGGIDILVNNAGIGRGPSGKGNEVNYEDAKAIMETNYYGTKRVTEGLWPLFRPSPAGARILNLTSGLSLYTRLRSDKLKQILKDEDNYTPELIDSLATKCLEDVKAGRYAQEGWVLDRGPMYSDSKILLNAYTKALAKSVSKSQPEDHQIFVTIVSPGVTMTDLLTRAVGENYTPPAGFHVKTPAEGADTGLWLALLPKEELASKHGKIWHDRKEYDWGREKLEMM